MPLWLLTQKTDEEGHVTRYNYEDKDYGLGNDGCVCALLKKIEFPTGLASEYTYERYMDQGEYLFRVKTRKDVINGKEYNKKTYNYSVSNFYKNSVFNYTVTETDELRGDTIYSYKTLYPDYEIKRK